MEPEADPQLQFQEDYVLENDPYFRHAYEALIPFFVEAWDEFQYPRPVMLPRIRAPEDTERTI